MDSLAFGSLAHVQILLLPVGPIQKTTFDKWSSEIRTFTSLRFSDIPSDSRDERARFMPNPLASGSIHLAFPSHPLPPSCLPLSLFRPSEFPLGVIGVASCSQSDSLSSIQSQFNTSFQELFPAGSVFPLASNCFVFEENDGNTNLNVGDHLPGLVVIPSMMGNKQIYVGTLLADLCSNILGGFATVTQSLESPLGNEYLNATQFPTLPPLSELPKPLDSDTLARNSLPPSHTSSQPELLGTGLQSWGKAGLAMKRNSSAGAALSPLPYRHSSLPTPAVKKRQLGIGAASSHGRLFKVLGDLFLLAGRTEDASVWYSEALSILKSPQDSIWHASALEALSTIPILEAWSSNNGMNGSTEDKDKDPWSESSEKLLQAIALYYKATPTNESDTNYPFLSYLYTRAVIRHTSLLLSIWSARGWGLGAFNTMLHPGHAPYLPPSFSKSGSISYADLEHLSSATGISRAQISASLAQAHGPWLLHLAPRERVNMLEAIAGMYGTLGYKRKEAYVLREVLGSVMDLVVCGREETGGGVRITNAGLGIHGVNMGGVNQGTVGVRTNDNVEGNESVLRIIKYICKVHGVDLEAVKVTALHNPTEPAQENPQQPDEDLVDASHEPYGWPELQIGIVREAIAVAEALPDFPSVAQFSLSALKTLYPVMSQGDQHHMYHTAARALTTALRRGDRRAVEYWSGRPIVSIEVSQLPLVRLPLEKPLSILSQRRSQVNPVLVGLTDPFLYNPRKLMSAQAQTMLVQNEIFEVIVTLRNPYIFDLELQSLSLSASGVPFESKPIPVVVPANSYHPITISGKALEPGILIVRGCIVQAPGGLPREFILPLSSEEEDEKRTRRRSALECEAGRSKRSGLESRPWERAEKRGSQTQQAMQKQARFLQCTVVPEQPLVRIRRSSLTHGAVMLYNGESSMIRITLENVSALPVDFVRLTFDDSTIAPGQAALAEGSLSVFDTYETEYELVRRPVFTWDTQADTVRIAPGEKTVLTIACFGKVGCVSGVIHVSYAYVYRRSAHLEEPPEVFHTRQVSYPVVVTVYHMLECHGMEILPYAPDALLAFDQQIDNSDKDTRKTLLRVEDAVDWCLFSVEVRNTYGLPFEVTFERDQPGTEPATTWTLVPPGSTCRILMPLRKMRLPEDDIARPIPTLSDRQFVITKSGLSAEAEAAQRELFWYREALFSVVRGRWKESGGTRAGELSLRQQRLTMPMLKVLRTDVVRVDMSLVCYDTAVGSDAGDDGPDGSNSIDDDGAARGTVLEVRGGKCFPPANEFVYLRVRATNQSPDALVLTLDLDLTPAQHVLSEGARADIPLGRVDAGAAQMVEVPVVFVAGGQFALAAEVRVLGAAREAVGRGALRAVVAS